MLADAIIRKLDESGRLLPARREREEDFDSAITPLSASVASTLPLPETPVTAPYQLMEEQMQTNEANEAVLGENITNGKYARISSIDAEIPSKLKEKIARGD